MLWDLHTVETRCGEIGLSVNFDKTELVLEGEGNVLVSLNIFSLKLPFQCSMSVKYLGIVLDSWLTCREQVNTKLKKDHNLVWAFRRAYFET